jgi:hypothetical protein
MKPKEAPICKRKVVRFVGSDSSGVVATAPAKVTKTDRVGKKPITFEKGT